MPVTTHTYSSDATGDPVTDLAELPDGITEVEGLILIDPVTGFTYDIPYYGFGTFGNANLNTADTTVGGISLENLCSDGFGYTRGETAEAAWGVIRLTGTPSTPNSGALFATVEAQARGMVAAGATLTMTYRLINWDTKEWVMPGYGHVTFPGSNQNDGEWNITTNPWVASVTSVATEAVNFAAISDLRALVLLSDHDISLVTPPFRLVPNAVAQISQFAVSISLTSQDRQGGWGIPIAGPTGFEDTILDALGLEAGVYYQYIAQVDSGGDPPPYLDDDAVWFATQIGASETTDDAGAGVVRTSFGQTVDLERADYAVFGLDIAEIMGGGVIFLPSMLVDQAPDGATGFELERPGDTPAVYTIGVGWDSPESATFAGFCGSIDLNGTYTVSWSEIAATQDDPSVDLTFPLYRISNGAHSDTTVNDFSLDTDRHGIWLAGTTLADETNPWPEIIERVGTGDLSGWSYTGIVGDDLVGGILAFAVAHEWIETHENFPAGTQPSGLDPEWNMGLTFVAGWQIATTYPRHRWVF